MLVASLAASACGADGSTAKAPVSEAPSAPRVAIDDAQLRQRVDEFVAGTATPVVAVAVQHASEPPHVFVADNGGIGAPARRDTRFRIGSVSKIFVGALILTLVRDGKVALDDVLADYEPTITGADRITIDDLLHHTSGLAPEGGEGPNRYADAWNAFTLARLTRKVTSDEVIEFVRDRPLLFEPGSSERYSNINVILLGRIAERLTGLPLHRALRERVLDPLELGHTALWPNDPTVQPDAGVLVVNGRRISTEQISVLGTLSAIGAAGSMVSTIDDVAALGSAYLRRHELLPVDLARDAFTINRFGTGSGVLGFAPEGTCALRPRGCPEGTTFWGRGGVGNVPGGSSVVLYNPRFDVVVAVLTNLEGAPTGQLAGVLLDNVVGVDRRMISATVVDSETAMPLQGATASDEMRFMTTGPDGKFLLLGVTPDAIVRITKPGYEPIERPARDIAGVIKMHASAGGRQ